MIFLSSLNTFVALPFVTKRIAIHFVFENYGNNVRITWKGIKKFFHILNKHKESDIGIYKEEYFSNDSSLLVILCRHILRPCRGGVWDEGGGTKQRKQYASPDTHLHA